MSDEQSQEPPKMLDLGALQRRVLELQQLLQMADGEAEKAIAASEAIEQELNNTKRVMFEQTAMLLGIPLPNGATMVVKDGTPLPQFAPPAPLLEDKLPPLEPRVPGEPERQRRFGAFRSSRGS